MLGLDQISDVSVKVYTMGHTIDIFQINQSSEFLSAPAEREALHDSIH